jgi:hypothetical protein
MVFNCVIMFAIFAYKCLFLLSCKSKVSLYAWARSGTCVTVNECDYLLRRVYE